ncbi:MAG: ASCH domain-containing protein [Phycisphaeraceae bacterium]|nr:ASCH domain-containing protein [Phycisphaeraceae bacterium]
MTTHVAILLPRYLSLILAGRKTIESRLTRSKRPPFGCVAAGDVIYFKRSGGPYQAKAVVERVRYFSNLTPAGVRQIHRQFGSLIGGEPAYWQSKSTSRYATLIWLKNVQPVHAGPAIPSSGWQAWWVLKDSASTKSSAPPAASTAHFQITLTAGALRNRYIRLPRALADALRHRPLRLDLPTGAQIATEVTTKNILRYRAWGDLFRLFGVKPNHPVHFVRQAPNRYRVLFTTRPLSGTRA